MTKREKETCWGRSNLYRAIMELSERFCFVFMALSSTGLFFEDFLCIHIVQSGRCVRHGLCKRLQPLLALFTQSSVEDDDIVEILRGCVFQQREERNSQQASILLIRCIAYRYVVFLRRRFQFTAFHFVFIVSPQPLSSPTQQHDPSPIQMP